MYKSFKTGFKESDHKKDRSKEKELEREIKSLEKELNRKDKALPETAALLVLKKSSGNLGGVRGRKISIENRKNAVFLIKEANASGASLDKVCEILNISVRTFKRWQKEDTVKEDQR